MLRLIFIQGRGKRKYLPIPTFQACFFAHQCGKNTQFTLVLHSLILCTEN